MFQKQNKQKIILWNRNVSIWSNIFSNFRGGVRNFADIFIPLIPIFIAGGLSLAMTSLINQMSNNESATSAKKFFELIGGGILGSLPAFVGYTAMKKFGGNPILGLAIGIIMVAPSLLNGWVSSSNYVVHSFTETQANINSLKNQYVIDELSKFHDPFTGNFVDLEAAKAQIIKLVPKATFDQYSLQSILDKITNITELKSSLAIQTVDGLGHFIVFPKSDDLNLNSVIQVLDIVKTNNEGLQEVSKNISLNEFATMNGLTINSTPALFPSAPKFFSFSFMGYQAQVFPTLGIIGVAYWIEKLLKRFSHESFSIIVVPLGTVVLSLFLGFLFVGPLGRVIGYGITEMFQGIYKYTNWPGFGFGGALLGATYPFLVVTGLHQGFVPVEASLIAETLASYNHSFTWITAIASVSNVAQGMVGLTLMVMMWKKAPKAGSTALSGAISANLGITEPILFGINLPLKFGILAASVAGAFGGYYVGMTHTVANSMGSASWLGLVQFDFVKVNSYNQYISNYGFKTTPGLSTLSNGVNQIIALIITSLAAVSFTIIFAKTFGKKSYNEFIKSYAK